ncbi:NAD(P)-dependent alcohol dehydrogenase [Methylobacterium brachythecii]|uniref:NADP-dependent alcohol dehydrogenase n=1 Tax=Methylobacterium brachythecii TaxID=1176177 RepID=A0A7W6F9N0_9HYPH|nr:NAD(P)-dependent alcohol dehydrogenase [Methylobacterium brachythecii]MBB3905690.1 putative zinc-type alcohol dehydrogenase-like protein [Methylobacterium brachythecii]GLS47005.1 NADP-dependent alcohol dehydrogenase [Methylobacterium brachythecii]
MQTIGYAARSVESGLAPWEFERRPLREHDVAIEILYCGVCHSDLHQARNDWGGSTYPIVPGHEIVGRVTEIGKGVTAHGPGDLVAVGTLVDSCRECDQCRRGEQSMCRKGPTLTYGSTDRIDGTVTQGGYSKHIVVRDEFVLRVPPGLDPERVGPLLCAGITVYSPLRQWKIGPGSRVGVIGIGGLGHLAVRLAAGLGAEVTVITRSEGKAAEAKALGATGVLISTDETAMAAAASSFDLIIDTVPVAHAVEPYARLLDIESTLVIVGLIGEMPAMSTVPLLLGRRRITGSPSGGIPETQELLDFCADKQIVPETETIAIADINDAFERMERGQVRYRFVIDMATLEPS